MIGTATINEIVAKISVGYQPQRIVLFGSYASGNASENSDLDILVIKKTDLPRPQRAVAVRKMLYGMGVPIGLIVYTPKEWAEATAQQATGFVHEILANGKTLYEHTS